MNPTTPSLKSADQIRNAYMAVPASIEALQNDGVLQMVANTEAELAQLLEYIQGLENALPPTERSHRLALLTVTTEPSVIDKDYEHYAQLPQLQGEISDRVKSILGSMNNYDPYINVRGVIDRKRALLDQYGQGSDSTREQRFAILALQAIDIMKGQRTTEGPPSEEVLTRVPQHDPYKGTIAAAQAMLHETGAHDVFKEMGFTIPEDIRKHAVPEEHPSVPRVQPLSGVPGEYAFIAVHQVFETYFHEAIEIMHELRNSTEISEEECIQKLNDIGLILETANRHYAVLEGLLPSDQFHEMRVKFGIASGAQSQQYHLLEQYIGYPNGNDFRKRRLEEIGHIIGPSRVTQLQEEGPLEHSLKERYRDVSSPQVASALRRLNLSLIQFKAVHGSTMLTYLPPHVPGTAGTKITEYFAQGMGTVFPVFTDQEKTALQEACEQGIHRGDENPTDRFEAAKQFALSTSNEIPKELFSRNAY